MNIPPSTLRLDFARAAAWWGELLDAAEAAHGIPARLLGAVCSRETNLGRHWDTAAPTSWAPTPTDDRLTWWVSHPGDEGHGHGLPQIDDRSHAIPEDWATDVAWQLDAGATILAACLAAEGGDVVAGLNRYNSGQPLSERTTGGDYGPDVAERWAFLVREFPAARPKEDPVPDVASADKALDWLRANLGTGEQPPGSNANFITRWGGVGNVAWCDICFWASECAAWGTYDARRLPEGYPLATDYPWGDAYVPDTRHHFRLADRYDRLPEVGAAAIFDWSGAPEVSTLVAQGWAEAGIPVDVDPPGDPAATRGPKPKRPPAAGLVAFEDIGDHIGRVEAWVDRDGNLRTDDLVAGEWDHTVITLEGNADNDLVRKRRPMTLIDGFGHMTYPTPAPQEDDDMGLFIFNAPPERAGGVYYADGYYMWGVPNEASLVWFRTGKVPHVGTVELGVFDNLRWHDTGAKPNPGVGLAQLAGDGLVHFDGHVTLAELPKDLARVR